MIHLFGLKFGSGFTEMSGTENWGYDIPGNSRT